MRYLRWGVLLGLLLLGACQPQDTGSYAIVDGARTQLLATSQRTPAVILAQVGIQLEADDQLLCNGVAVDPAVPLSGTGSTLQVRRAASITVNGTERRTTARTV